MQRYFYIFRRIPASKYAVIGLLAIHLLPIEVTDGTLIQVTHAASRDYDSRWVWSGLTIQNMR